MRLTLALLAAPLFAATATVDVTATQAIITYDCAGANTIDVREFGAATVVHDVDATLFTGANLDSRSTGITSGSHHRVVVGKRAAETALDGKLYSRALQAYTLHSYSLCGGTITGTFLTSNPPVGQGYGDPPPVDPTHPGSYAWPTVSWTDRTQTWVDPQTGFLMRLLDYPTDNFQPGNMFNAYIGTPGGTNWTGAGNVTADDSSAATYSAATQDPLFIPTGMNNSAFANKSPTNSTISRLNPTFNAWAAASANAEIAITVDGHAPVTGSSWIAHALSACSSNCTVGNRFTLITSPAPMLADWFPSNAGLTTVDLADFMVRSGTVSRTGTAVTWTGGNRFSLKWNAGSLITINSTVYTIASVDNDEAITLASGAGNDPSTTYTASNGGFLLRNATTSGNLSIQYATFAYEVSSPAPLEAGGDLDQFNNCSPFITTYLGAPGRRCINGGMVRWVANDITVVNRLGNAKPQFNGSDPQWGSTYCAATYWDQADANAFYCTVADGNRQTRVLKWAYTGSNADIGDTDSNTSATYCGSSPCWTVTMITASSIETQIAAFDPRWVASSFNAQETTLFGHMASTNALLFNIYSGSQNTPCFVAKLDITTGLIVASANSFSSWPLKWSACHGQQNIADPRYVIMTATTFRGTSWSGPGAPGDGPYFSTVTNAVSGTAASCGSIAPTIQVPNPPSGSHCSTFTLDGEPGDPSPYQDSSGTITTSGTTVIGSGTSFLSGIGRQIKIAGTYYPVTTITDSTHLTIGSTLGLGIPTAYTIYYEPVNNPKLANAGYAYLADLGIGDFVSIAAVGANGAGGSGQAYYPAGNEIARVVGKSGSGPGATITVERGYGGAQGYTALSSFSAGGATISPLPGGCGFTSVAPCDQTFVDWDTLLDTLEGNSTGTTLTLDTNDLGCCHSTEQNIRVNFGSTSCATPNRDGISSVCYYARSGTIPAVYTAPGNKVSISPLFHGLAGVAVSNMVDTHPSHNQFLATVGSPDYAWVGDVRIFNGDDSFTLFGSSGSPGIATGQRWKFTAAQASRLRPRVLPTFAFCGTNALKDISAPASSLGSTSADSYKYCIANTGGECVGGSTAGDVYVNCPQMRLGYTAPPTDYDARDMLVADMSAYLHADIQVGVSKSDPDGAAGRVVSKMDRYKTYIFENNKISPDGRIMFKWATAVNGVRRSTLVVKLPPFPAGDSINRNDYVPITVKIPTVAGVNNVIVKFGYDTSFNCTTRTDACIANTATVPTGATPFAYSSESPSGLACSSGCTIQIPAISQRIVYYQVVYRDAGNATVRTDAMGIVAVP